MPALFRFRAPTPGARHRADAIARVVLTICALLPYWRLLTFGVIFITDDYFASDIFNGELPGRVLAGRLIRHGELPAWTHQLCSGLPLAGVAMDPIGMGPFVLFPPAIALDLFVIVLLLVAAHGTYALARRFDADRIGAVLAGVAFAGSGYIACQLKHLAIVSTIVWFPVGLLLLDKILAASPTSGARRALYMGAFGLVLAEQALSGFPQSIYICGLAYGAFVLFRAIGNRRALAPMSRWCMLLAGIALVTALGAAAGAIVLLPLSKLGAVSDRAEALGWAWSTLLAYWPPNIITFFLPYAHGDIANNTYAGPPFFWEDYGYVGLATALLAIYEGVRGWRRPITAFLAAMTVLAYLFVVGAATPVFHVAWLVIPGMKLFRFPTRFLFIVDLGLALLAALGLTRVRAELTGWLTPKAESPGPMSTRIPAVVVTAICALTVVDLTIHQPRQNPMVPAREWLAAPASVAIVKADGTEPRTFTPWVRALHRRTFQEARGWTDVRPYFELRDVLQPNVGGGFWSVPSADCYAGISARWYVDVWGDHNREAALVPFMAFLDFKARTLNFHRTLFPRVMGLFGVTHVLSPYPQNGNALPLAGRTDHAYIYRVPHAARVRFVAAARAVANDAEGVKRLLADDFDPDREVVVHDTADAPPHPTIAEAGANGERATGRATIVHEEARELVVDADASQDGFLLLADTYYPGWFVEIDGRPAPMYRANLMLRAVPLSRGHHAVRFVYDPPGLITGLQITMLSVSLLVLWLAVAAYIDRRHDAGAASA
ncbi:MAG TPA: YfhO family protein [Vicinamibacterales bacterium]